MNSALNETSPDHSLAARIEARMNEPLLKEHPHEYYHAYPSSIPLVAMRRGIRFPTVIGGAEMISHTREHALPLSGARRLLVTVTESPDTVYIHIAGDKALPSELSKVHAFMHPIVSPFGTDPRPVELDGTFAKSPIWIHDIAPGVTVACRVNRGRGNA